MTAYCYRSGVRENRWEKTVGFVPKWSAPEEASSTIVHLKGKSLGKNRRFCPKVVSA